MTHPERPGVPRLVVDPGVWVSAAITANPGPADMLLSMATDDEVVLLVSPKLLSELQGVLARPKFRRYLSLADASEFVAALRMLGKAVDDADLSSRVPTCRDPGDEYLVALAQAYDALFLVSGDKDVLAVHQPGLLVRSPRDAAESLLRRHAWGRALVPTGDSDEGWRQAEAEGHATVLAAASAFLAVVKDPSAADLLDRVVTPESWPVWSRQLDEIRQVVADRGMASRPGRPAPGCAYVALPPDPGETVRATGTVLLPPETLTLTLQDRPELGTIPGLGGWRVHALGAPVLPDQLPPTPDLGDVRP